MNTVAILTPHYAYNYGAKLQAFALAEAIRKLGNNIIFINRRPKESYCVSDKPLHWIHEKERQTRLKGFIEFEKNFYNHKRCQYMIMLIIQILIFQNTKQSLLEVIKFGGIVFFILHLDIANISILLKTILCEKFRMQHLLEKIHVSNQKKDVKQYHYY